MGRIARTLAIAGALAAGLAAFRAWRARTPREQRDAWARRLMNERIAPRLVEAGVAGSGRSEIGIIEHVGRVTGTVRRTPIHPNPVPGGFAISIPYGPGTQWVRNIMVAGRCTMRLHDVTHELTNPRIARGGDVPGLPRIARAIGMPLGDEYLVLDLGDAPTPTADDGTTAPTDLHRRAAFA
jgi:hypothetical protein